MRRLRGMRTTLRPWQFDVASRDKRWSIEAKALNLVKKEASDVFGIVLSYRF